MLSRLFLAAYKASCSAMSIKGRIARWLDPPKPVDEPAVVAMPEHAEERVNESDANA
jgi:hypothetical protein